MFTNSKKILSITLSLLMLFSLGACKKGNNESNVSYIYEYLYEDDEVTSNTDANASTQTGSTASSKTKSEATESKVPDGIGVNNNIDPGRVKDLKGRTFTYVATWDPTNRNSKAGKLMREVEKLLNCKIVEKKMSDYKPLYSSILAGKPLCDMFSPYDTTALAMANKGMLISFSDLSNFNQNDYYWDKSCIKENTLNGKIYGIACTPSVRSIIMYNKTMFQKNGWDDLYELQKKDQLSWDKMFQIMQAAVQLDSSENVTRYGLVPQYGFDGLGLQMIWANGGKIVERVGDTTNFNYTLTASNATNALTTLNKWVSHKGAVYNATNFGWDTGRSVFASGNAAMLIADSFQFNDAIAGNNFVVGMVAFPHGPDSTKNLVQYNATPTVIPKNVENPDDVMLIWDFLTQYRGTRADNYGDVSDIFPDPSAQATIDWYINSLQSLDYTEDYGRNNKVVIDAINKAAYGEITPAASVSSIQNQVMSNLNDFWK